MEILPRETFNRVECRRKVERKKATIMPFNLMNGKVFETFEGIMSVERNGQDSDCAGLEGVKRPLQQEVTCMLMKEKRNGCRRK